MNIGKTFLKLLFIIFINGTFTACYAHTPTITIKLAILDSPNMPQKLSLWSQYEKSYVAGIQTAAEAAKRSGLTIQYKTFFYGTEPLDVLSKIPEVQAWQPDIILGPHYSNQFLLLKNYFPHTLVLSSYASDVAVESMPKNFYSLCLSDNYQARVMSEFIRDKFPDQPVYIIVQADCKSCVGMSNLFVENYKKFTHHDNFAKAKFIQNSLDSLDVKKLMAGHEKDVILILPANYYTYNTLINRIAESLSNIKLNKKITFITNVDNWGSAVTGSALGDKNILNYQSYRIVPASFNIYAPNFENFNQDYYQAYHTKPTGAVSYMTYITVMSMVAALNKFTHHTDPNMNTREKVLASYLAALANEPNWFRPKNYTIYELTPHGETLIKTIPLSALN